MKRFISLLPAILLVIASASAETQPTTATADSITAERAAAADERRSLTEKLSFLQNSMLNLQQARGLALGKRESLKQNLARQEQALDQLEQLHGKESRHVVELTADLAETQELLDAADARLETENQRVAGLSSEIKKIEHQVNEKEAMIAGLTSQEGEALAQNIAATFEGRDRSEIERIVLQADLERKQTHYAMLEARLRRMKSMFASNLVSTDEVVEMEEQVALAKFDLLKAQAEFALRQLENERGGFEDRNAADSTEAALQTQFFRGYLDAVERYAQLSSNPRNAGVAAVVTAADMLRDQPPQATIDFFAPLLEAGQFPDYTVETAVRLQLAEAYRAADQTDKALETLRTLIVASSGSGGGLGERVGEQ